MKRNIKIRIQGLLVAFTFVLYKCEVRTEDGRSQVKGVGGVYQKQEKRIWEAGFPTLQEAETGKTFHHCAVLGYFAHQRSLEILRGRGFSKANVFSKGNWGLNQKKKPSVGEM